jgi:cation diffusion facilitator CzcD-associated flavoprotein CzcO
VTAGYPDFAGEVLYGDAWRGYDFSGLRVAVLATGRDAARVVPRVSLTACSVKVFLADADWVVPTMPRALSGLARAGAHVPLVGPRARRSLARAHLRLAVRDPWTRRLLTPDDRFTTHVTSASSSYYPALQGPDCKLIRWPVYAVTERGVRTAEGIEHRVDCLVVPTPLREERTA